MFRWHVFAPVVLIIACSSSTASAGPLLTWLGFEDNPPRSYSAFHYWTPAAVRVNDHFHAPRASIYAPDRHPEIPPSQAVLQYPNQIAAPSETIFVRPTAPATSPAR